MKRVIVVAPHPDDEIIGCGGALIKHKNEGNEVFVLYLSTGEYFLYNKKEYMEKVKIRKQEAEVVCKNAGIEFLYWSNIPAREIQNNQNKIKKDMIKIFQHVKPHFIYIPNFYEKDLDHSITNSLTKEAYWLSKALREDSKNNNVSAQIYSYEVWSPLNNYHLVIDITKEIDDKLNLISLYDSQLKTLDYRNGIKGLNKYRACLSSKLGYSEVFLKESL